MKYLIQYNGNDPFRDRIAKEIVAELEAHGCVQDTATNHLNFILAFTNFEHPQAVIRKAQNEFVVSLAVLHREVDDLRYLCYNTLIMTLSNLLICVKPNGSNPPEIYCITPEAGFYHFPYTPLRVYENMLPVIGAQFVINNRISTDLPQAYCQTKITEQLRHYGGVLDALGVLPTPFPLHDVLSEENIGHLYDLFRIKGLSYGNLSAREPVPEIGPDTFWMTARGVDKARLKGVGEDILLVTGYDAEAGEILVSVPPDSNPRIRVSVDAIEHTLIYRAFPEVGAIVHVHAWMQGVCCTRQNYPCGTIDLAEEVVDLLQTTDCPGRTAVGLKNHGLTITGPNLEDIFSRMEGKLLKEVPMML